MQPCLPPELPTLRLLWRRWWLRPFFFTLALNTLSHCQPFFTQPPRLPREGVVCKKSRVLLSGKALGEQVHPSEHTAFQTVNKCISSSLSMPTLASTVGNPRACQSGWAGPLVWFPRWEKMRRWSLHQQWTVVFLPSRWGEEKWVFTPKQSQGRSAHFLATSR